MKPGKILFLIINDKLRSGLIDPIRGKTIYKGNTEITAIKKPLGKLELSPRKEHIFFGFITILRNYYNGDSH